MPSMPPARTERLNKATIPPSHAFFYCGPNCLPRLGRLPPSPFPHKFRRRKKCPELKCRGKERVFLWESYVTTSCVFFSFFSLPQILEILWICVCVCRKKTRSFWTKIYRRRQWVSLSFYLGAADRSGKGKCSSSPSCWGILGDWSPMYTQNGCIQRNFFLKWVYPEKTFLQKSIENFTSKWVHQVPSFYRRWFAGQVDPFTEFGKRIIAF